MQLPKIFSYYLITGLLLISSCHPTPVYNPSNASWTIRNIEYSAVSVKKQGSLFSASNGLNSMTVFFTAAPTVTANYKIADENKVGNNTLGSNEIAISFRVGGTDDYITTGIANDSATVSIEGGILTIKILSTPLEHYAGGYPIDTTTGSGVMRTNTY